MRSSGGEPAASASESPDAAAIDGSQFAGRRVFDPSVPFSVRHPRAPFHRIDIVHSSRQVRVETDGELLAESSDPCLLFEPPLPVRYYLPPDDLFWSYPEPLRDAAG